MESLPTNVIGSPESRHEAVVMTPNQLKRSSPVSLPHQPPYAEHADETKERHGQGGNETRCGAHGQTA